jgi:hypothetical protein
MSIVLQGSTSGSVTLQEPAVAGTTVLDLPATSGTVGLVSGNLGTPSALVGTNITGTATGLNAGIGVGQTWQDVSGSRTAGVTYTNSTGKPIMVSTRTTATATDFNITVDGVTTALVTNISTTRMFMTTIVPNGSTYSVSGYQAGFWSELR